MSLSKVIAVARSELGNTEWPPGSNQTKYGEAYGWDGVPYCVQFLWWVFQQAGEGMAFFNGGKTASCTRLMELYKAEGKWFTDGKYQPGDIAIMTFVKSRAIQHCGLIVGKSKDGGWITYEGNTTPGAEGSQYNGGCVAEKVRYAKNIIGVCRPTYKEEDEVPKDYENHWAAMEIRWAKDKGISNGYPDGTWRPDQQITRAEAVTMLYRYNDVVQKDLTELRQEIARLKEGIK